MGSGTRTLGALTLVGVLGLGLAGCRVRRPQDAPRIEPAWSSTPPRMLGKFAGRFFFIGAWCSPPTSTTDAEVWRRFSHTGLDLAVRPLEDTNDRMRNLATLALLDTLTAPPPVDPSIGFPVPGTRRVLVRDDAVHPDEASRPGWRDRVRDVVETYRRHPALAGYFLADEPAPEQFDQLAEVAAAFADADSSHPAYVNLLPLAADADTATQTRWRADASRLIRRGRLRLFSFAAYSQRPRGEDAAFLLTLANAARVSRESACPFAVVLQFTGFGPLAPVTFAQMNYLAAEAVAHGASGIIWFTYWTPNPKEQDMLWKGGAVEYDGAPSLRADSLLLTNARALGMIPHFIEGPTAIAHFGGAWPAGSALINQPIQGLAGTRGGPVTIAVGTSGLNRRRVWLVINRDRTSAHRQVTLILDRSVGIGDLVTASGGVAFTRFRVHPEERSVQLNLGPGETSLLELVDR